MYQRAALFEKCGLLFFQMQIGDYRVEIVPDTEFWLDGGAMFGVVPRVLWERVSPPDELNRVRLNMNCVFIDTGNQRLLIETGIGEKWTAKETSMYGITRERSLADSLRAITGCGPDDIDIVVNTHLHFDHAGGNTVWPETKAGSVGAESDKPRQAVPQFPNARYLVSDSELHHARNPHERDRASYLPENWEPVAAAGQLEVMLEVYEPVEGLHLQQVQGHSRTMQTWRLDRGGETVYGFADLVPTRHHLSPAWIMGFDLYPTDTLEFKKATLPQAAADDWRCLFYHDADAPLCRLTAGEKGITAIPA